MRREVPQDKLKGQVVVSLVVITLFVPCIANFLMIIKEFGGRTATAGISSCSSIWKSVSI